MSQISIALVDNHPITLEAVAKHVSSNDRYRVVARGSSSDEALEIVDRHGPDLLILELTVPGNALRVITNISARPRAAKVIVFTAESGIDAAIRALDAGASGYILKNSTAEELMYGIAVVGRGETYITAGIAGKVISALRIRSMRELEARTRQISVREEQIIRLLMLGHTNKEIADSLSISEKTVKHYMTILMQKFNARNRLGVVLAAQKMSGDAVGSGAAGPAHL